MLNSVEEIKQAFAGSALKDADFQPVPVLDTGEMGFELKLDGRDPVETWRTARQALDITGRWPLLVEPSGQDFYSRHAFLEVGDSDQDPWAIIERAAALSWPRDPDLGEFEPDHWPLVVEGEAAETARRVGDSPTVPALLERFPHSDLLGLDAYLLEWEEERKPTTGREIFSRSDLPWGIQYAQHLMLLPHSSPEAVPAFTYYWGVWHYSEPLISAIRSWNLRHGAEPCAAAGRVTLTFWVDRPPTELWDARQVTIEHEAFGRLDASTREGARQLLGDQWWVLWDRP